MRLHTFQQTSGRPPADLQQTSSRPPADTFTSNIPPPPPPPGALLRLRRLYKKSLNGWFDNIFVDSFCGFQYSLAFFGRFVTSCLASGNFIRYSHDCSSSIIKNCLASGYFINYSFVCLFVDSFRGLWYSLNRWIDNKFVNTLRGFKYSQFDRGFFNFDYLVSLFKYSLNNRLNDSFLNDNFVSSFVGVLICSLDKQFDIRLLEFFPARPSCFDEKFSPVSSLFPSFSGSYFSSFFACSLISFSSTSGSYFSNFMSSSGSCCKRYGSVS